MEISLSYEYVSHLVHKVSELAFQENAAWISTAILSFFVTTLFVDFRLMEMPVAVSFSIWTPVSLALVSFAPSASEMFRSLSLLTVNPVIRMPSLAFVGYSKISSLVSLAMR